LGLKEEINKLCLQVQERKSYIHNEEATKQALILPFIKTLNYDICNPLEVLPEYVADFAKKKGEKVDYAICKDGQPIIFIEAKSISETLDNHNAQLSRYFNSTPTVKFGILTNGIKYKFFTDLVQPNMMDITPFFELDIENPKDDDLAIINHFHKDHFDINIIMQTAEELVYTANVTKNLKSLFNSPPDDFIRYLIKDLNKSKITSAVVEKFRPIVKKALTQTVLDVVREGILRNNDNDSNQEALATEKNIETSLDEIQAYDCIKNVLTQAGRNVKAINHKDTVSYFGIYNQNITRWFIRLYFDKTPYSLIIRLNYDTTKDLHSELIILPSGKDGKETKILINSIQDINKISDLITKSFDAANS
jgi:predicted type IV restriction endonuclease